MRKLLFVAALSGVVTLSGCSLSQMVKMAKDQQLTVTPSPLEVHADKVEYEISALLPVKMLKKGKVYTVNNFYQYGEQEIGTGSIEFKADDYPNNKTEQPRTSKKFMFDYQPAMKRGDLLVQGVASNPKNGKSKSTDRMKIAEGVITTSKLVKDSHYAAYADHGYNNQEELIPTHVEFFFQQGSSALRYSEKNSDRGKNFNAFVAEKNVTRTVTITGAHSPEGAERINSRLAADRAEAIENYYRKQMKKYDYSDMADEIKFVLKPVVEDWTSFKAMLNNYNGISSDQKSEILNIVNGSGSFEDKEDKLHKLSSYRKVFKDVYPKLRTAKTEILTVKEKKTDAEISMLSKQMAKGQAASDALSDEELAYGATLTPDLKEKEAIYKAAIKKNDSWVAHNNLGAVYINMAAASKNEADMNKYGGMALTQAELSNKKKANPEALTNMAVVYLMQGNNEKAMESLNKAMQMSPSRDLSMGINSVKGVLEIKYASYDVAVNTLSNTHETADNLFNKGLAQLLKKDYQNALTTFNEATAKNNNHALAHYCAAIASARLQNASGVGNHLKKAVSSDNSLKQAALDDLEFRDYKDSAEFQNALK